MHAAAPCDFGSSGRGLSGEAPRGHPQAQFARFLSPARASGLVWEEAMTARGRRGGGQSRVEMGCGDDDRSPSLHGPRSRTGTRTPHAGAGAELWTRRAPGRGRSCPLTRRPSRLRPGPAGGGGAGEAGDRGGLPRRLRTAVERTAANAATCLETHELSDKPPAPGHHSWGLRMPPTRLGHSASVAV